MRVQILFVAGVAMTIGAQATFRFFLRRKNQRVIFVGPKSPLQAFINASATLHTALAGLHG